MSIATNARIAGAVTPSFSVGRFAAFAAGIVVVGVEAIMTRAELHKSRRQLAELDDRLLRDIGIDRGIARYEATKGFFG